MPNLRTILTDLRNVQANLVKDSVKSDNQDTAKRALAAAILIHEAATKIETAVQRLDTNHPLPKPPKPKAAIKPDPLQKPLPLATTFPPATKTKAS